MKQSNQRKSLKNISMSTVITIEIIIMILILCALNIFSTTSDASIETGNLNARSKVGTWLINSHKMSKSKLQVVQHNNQEHIIYNHEQYKLVPHITKKRLKNSYLKKMYHNDRVFEIKNNHNTKILIQIKAPKSLNHMPIYNRA